MSLLSSPLQLGMEKKEEEGRTACRYNTGCARITTINHLEETQNNKDNQYLPSKNVFTVKLEKKLL